MFCSPCQPSNSELTNNSADSGGAIGVISGNVSISNSELTNNSADWSGAIYVISGSVSISNCELTNNSADSAGGAIGVISGNVSISNSELTNNSADWSGAIYVISGSVSISNCELTNNSADHGVIYIAQSLLILKNTNITNNTASFMVDGSSIYAAANSRVEFNGPTTLSNNRGMLGGAISIVQSEIYINTEGVIITNNTATSGGGIFLRESTLFINEPIKIYQNTAHQDGGEIYAYSSTIIFNTPNKQSEITNNNAENGGGINVVATTLNLTRSYVNIDSNTANANGGGVYLQQSSKLYLFKNDEEYRTQDQHVKLMINNNSARYGGGIFVADGTESGACRVGVTDTDDPHIIFADCFIQTIKLYEWSKNNSNYFNTFITNNTAQSGANIYGGLLDRCTISKC